MGNSPGRLAGGWAPCWGTPAAGVAGAGSGDTFRDVGLAGRSGVVAGAGFAARASSAGAFFTTAFFTAVFFAAVVSARFAAALSPEAFKPAAAFVDDFAAGAAFVACCVVFVAAVDVAAAFLAGFLAAGTAAFLAGFLAAGTAAFFTAAFLAAARAFGAARFAGAAFPDDALPAALLAAVFFKPADVAFFPA
ncbi:MAG TPA: hypothetical protein VHC41_03595 [Mycobacteriales bacterium]|nr:hypothetical protein [Mycobacteriales bacterium]